MKRVAFLLMLALAAVATASCGDNGGVDPGPTLAGPFPSFPYAFSGNFTVNGEPGPAGTLVFARMGDTHADPAAAPSEGSYNNIVIGPSHERAADMEQPIKFYLGTPDGPSVEAEETFEFKVVSTVTNVELDLTFPRLP